MATVSKSGYTNMFLTKQWLIECLTPTPRTVRKDVVGCYSLMVTNSIYKWNFWKLAGTGILFAWYYHPA
jgi:hypothetical protein